MFTSSSWLGWVQQIVVSNWPAIVAGSLALIAVLFGIRPQTWNWPSKSRSHPGESAYPKKIASSDQLDMRELLDGINYAATRIRAWDERNCLIVGINRGGSIVAGLLSKQLNHSNIGLASFDDDGTLYLAIPDKPQNRSRRRVVIVDDQVNTGTSAREVSEALQKKWTNIDVLFVILKSIRNPIEPGDGSSPKLIILNDKESLVYLFETSATLPWNAEDLRVR